MNKAKHTPPSPSKIGEFSIKKRIAQGGMGEIFLAKDPLCKRLVALKRIHPRLLKYEILRKRFLKEAHITAQLSHPAIVPIYSIHQEKKDLYYTMAYVEGMTLKEKLREQSAAEKASSETSFSSFHGLLQNFLSLCQCVAYIHSKQIIHRDLKPENILLGKFGQVIILDWGLAKFIGEPCELEQLQLDTAFIPDQLTTPGKVVGTPSYLAPERAQHTSADVLQDIYSLGVILYHILTLKLPHQRESVKDFLKKVNKEEIIPPCEMAPYRDIPKILEKITQKCLEPSPADRYQEVTSLIKDLQGYFEGRAEWFLSSTLHTLKKEDWEFQENVPLYRHLTLDHSIANMEWVNLMISKESFPGNLMVKTRVRIQNNEEGIGLLCSIPSQNLRKYPTEGLCIWLGSDEKVPSALYRSSYKIIDIPSAQLSIGCWHEVKIEKIDNHLYLHLDGKRCLSYVLYTPAEGAHIGVLSRGNEVDIAPVEVFSGSQSVQVSCLAVPDALLAKEDYAGALHEYRRIGQAFPGRAEGREGFFRAGVTLLEEAKKTSSPSQKERLFQRALDEFEVLRSTPGAPLEYLGKALTYQAMQELHEEAKCLELALRKFRSHPLIPLLREHITFRLRESSHQSRQQTLRFMLLLTLFFPETINQRDILPLFQSLQDDSKLPYFFPECKGLLLKTPRLYLQSFLSFWTERSPLLVDLAQQALNRKSPPTHLLFTLILSLYELGDKEQASLFLNQAAQRSRTLKNVSALLQSPLDQIPPINDPDPFYTASITYRFFEAFDTCQWSLLPKLSSLLSADKKFFLNTWALLVNHQPEAAIKQMKQLNNQERMFFFGCHQAMVEGEQSALSYFRKESPEHNTPFSLTSRFLSLDSSQKNRHLQTLTTWEKKNLLRHWALFELSLGNESQAKQLLQQL